MFEKKYTLHPETLQVQSTNPFAAWVTGSRAAMYASEIGQAPPISNCQVKLIQSGMEREYGKYTFMVKTDSDIVLEKVFNHYSPSLGLNSFGRDIAPTTLIYQDMSTDKKLATYGTIHIPSYSQNHHALGFNFVRTPISKGLYPGVSIPRGTVFAHSPSLTEPGGEYRNGTNANICLASFPGCRQDGIIMRRGFAEKTKFRGYEEVTLSFDGEEIPLNIYGDDNEYKIFPDVGDTIRDDGIVFATRKLISELYPVQMSRSALRIPVVSDKVIRYKGGGGKAKVVSVQVFHSPDAATGKSRVPTGMQTQCEKYLAEQSRMARELGNYYNELVRRHGGRENFNLTPELHNLLVSSELYNGADSRNRQRMMLTSGTTPLKEYTVKIVYTYEIDPIAAFKMADTFGGKGVFVEIRDDHLMPCDADGVVADIIMDGASIVNRLNPGRLYEIMINHIFNKIRREVIRSVGEDGSVENKHRLWEWVHRAYQIISPRFADVVAKHDKLNHINAILKDDIVIWLPTDTNNPLHIAMQQLMKEYPPTYDYLTLTKPDGTKVLSKDKGIIGKQYIMILDKTGEEYSAVSTPVLQHQGVPGKLSKVDKQSSPGRPQATRITGETEGRLLNSLAYYDSLFMLLDIANSPTTQRAVTRTLLTHPTPTNIEEIVDRNIYPRHNNRIVNITANNMLVAGFVFKYKPISGD